jgi:hypothetical protein
MSPGRPEPSSISLSAPHVKPHDVASLLAEATQRGKARGGTYPRRRVPKPHVARVLRPLADLIAVSSPTAQVVANIAVQNIAVQLSPVTVVPMNSGEAEKSAEPLRARDETLAAHRIVTPLVVAVATTSQPRETPLGASGRHVPHAMGRASPERRAIPAAAGAAAD